MIPPPVNRSGHAGLRRAMATARPPEAKIPLKIGREVLHGIVTDERAVGVDIETEAETGTASVKESEKRSANESGSENAIGCVNGSGSETELETGSVNAVTGVIERAAVSQAKTARVGAEMVETTAGH